MEVIDDGSQTGVFMSSVSVSVVMPALNEEENIQAAIESTFKAFERRQLDGEIIAVNDGSVDQTGKIITDLMKIYPNLKVVKHDQAMGIGRSFFDGVKAATKDVVVMFPGDNENNPDDALNFISILSEVDIVVPFIQNIEVRNKGRRLLSSTYRFIINMSFGINLNYTNGTVFYRRAILSEVELISSGFFYQAELLIKLIRNGYLFAEVPNFLFTRGSGKSKATTLKSLIRVMKSYLKLFHNIHFSTEGRSLPGKELNKQSVSYRKYQALKESF